MFERLKLLWASARLIRDPNRLDEVFDLAEGLTKTADISEMIDRIQASSATAARAYVDRPRVSVDREMLAALPPGTLGREFSDYLERNKLDPDVFLGRPAETDTEFTLTHLYETHDIWHVVTGFKTDVPGELGLQAFYLAQFGGLLAMLLLPLGMINTLIYRRDEVDARMGEITRGWQLGKKARSLFGIDWTPMFDRPLAAIRAELGIEVVETTELAA